MLFQITSPNGKKDKIEERSGSPANIVFKFLFLCFSLNKEGVKREYSLNLNLKEDFELKLQSKSIF